MSALFPAEAGCETVKRIVICWSLLRNSNIATNFQRFTWNNVRREGILPHVSVERRYLGR